MKHSRHIYRLILATILVGIGFFTTNSFTAEVSSPEINSNRLRKFDHLKWPFHLDDEAATAWLQENTSPEKQDLLLSVIRRIVGSYSEPKAFEGLSPGQAVTVWLARYNLLLLEGKSVEAHQAFAHAFELNARLADPAERERNYVEFALYDEVDFYRDETIDGLKTKKFAPPDPRKVLQGSAGRDAGARWTTGRALLKLVSAIESLSRINRELPAGAVAVDLMAMHDQLLSDIHSNNHTQEPIALAARINLWLMFERVYLHMHQIKIANRIHRKVNEQPFSSAIAMDTKVFSYLTSFAKREVLLLTNTQTERLMFGEDPSSEDATILLRYARDLLRSSSQPFNGRDYYDAKANLHLAFLFRERGQLHPFELLVKDSYPVIERIEEPRERAEMIGFYRLYSGQLNLLAGKVEMAISDYQKSIEAFSKIDNPNAVEAWGELAQAYIAGGDHEKAIALNSEVAVFLEKIKDRFAAEELDRHRVTLQVALTEAYYFKNDFPKMREAIKETRWGRTSRVIALFRLYEGLALLAETKDCEKAVWELEGGLDALAGNEIDQISEILNLKAGQCNDQLGNKEMALSQLETAFIINRNMRKAARGSIAYSAFYHSDTVEEIEQSISKVILDLMNEPEADMRKLSQKLFFFGEMSKSRGLVDEIEANTRGLQAINPGLSPEEIRVLREQLGALDLPIYSELDVENIDTSNTFDAYQKFLATIAKRHGKPTVLIEYVPVTQKDRVVLFVMDEKSTSTSLLKTPWSEIIKRVAELRRHIDSSVRLYQRVRKSPTPNPAVVRQIQHVEESINNLSAELGTMLIPPDISGIKNWTEYLRGKSLILTPNGPLHNLPFAALKLKDGDQSKYLIDMIERLVTVPSTSLLSLILRRRRGLQDEKIARVLLVGESDNPTLPAVKSEFEGIKSVVHSVANITSETELAGAVPQHSALHFGVHAFFDRSNPAQSGLSLKGGTLTLTEIMTLKSFRPRIVSMGACESGEASISSGDEVWSLATGFIFAGSPAVVGSLWEQEDDSARNFYTSFYKEMAVDGNPGSAFYAAMMKTRQSENSATRGDVPGLMNRLNPCFWAGFVFIGE